MPELPEVQTVVSELNQKLKNKTVHSVSVATPKMVAIGPAVLSNIRTPQARIAARFARLLAGKKVHGVARRAKLLIFELSDQLRLLVHLKMTGQFIYEDRQLRAKTGGRYRMLNKLTAPLVQLPGKHTHVTITFTDGSHLYFNDMRQFGYLKLVQAGEMEKIPELRQYGPEPLEKSFVIGRFLEPVLRRKNGKIKQVLMDPAVVAGIGNIYSDEILFHAGVRPVRTVGSLSVRELGRVYAWIAPVLRAGIRAKGSSVGDFVRTDGSWGGMGKFHFVYGRGGQACKKCGTIIATVKINGRTGSYCPRCQQ